MMTLKSLRRRVAGGLWWVASVLPVHAALAADGVPSPRIDQAWRDRFVMGAFADGLRHASKAAARARAALEVARAKGDLRDELRAAASYFAAAKTSSAEDCKTVQRYVALARSSGPSYEPELFDLGFAAATARFDAPCPGRVTVQELESLAQRLGDPARFYFVWEAIGADPEMGGRFGDVAAIISKQLEYAIAGFQRANLYLVLANGNQAVDPQGAQSRRWLETARQEFEPDEFPGLAADLDSYLALLEFRTGHPTAGLAAMQRALPRLRDGAAEAQHTASHFLGFAVELTKLHRPDQALAHLEEASQLEFNYPITRFAIARAFIHVYEQLGTPDAYLKGEREIQRISELAASDPASLASYPRLYQQISMFYEKFGRFQAALQAHQRFVQLRDEFQRRMNETARIQAETRLNVALKDKENAQLKAEAELQAVRQRGWIAAFAVAAVGVMASGAALTVAMRRGRRLARVSAELEHRNDELEQGSASRIRLLAAACHDLRQPAHALGMLAELGSDAQQDPARFSAWMQSVRRSTASLGEMLDELMDLGRLDGGHYTAMCGDVPLGELMQEVMLHFGPLARRKGLTLEAPPVDLHVSSDRHLLRRILFNVVSNAIKYTDTGDVRVSLEALGDQVRLSVQDSGPGIPQDKIDDVFLDYVRLNPLKATEGLGIGLSIVRRAAELLGHELSLTSAPGEGTCVSLTLPVIREPRAAAAVAEDPAAMARGGVVAVVENDADVREAMASLLRSWGYTVCAGGNADAVLALAAAQRLPLELVITDLHLDNTDGLTEVARLRQALKAPGLPALLVTGDLDGAITSQAAQVGVYVAHKPLAPRKLAALVRQLPGAPQGVPAATALRTRG